tara:strand:- start:4955 stop:6166 length:1212 start_codon:yes stop_codon:yes gene_type:complete
MANSIILNSYTGAELKKLIASTNIKGYSKLPKPELIKLMLRAEHIDRFKSVKMKAKRSAPVSEKDQKQKMKLLRELKKSNKPKVKKDIDSLPLPAFPKDKKLSKKEEAEMQKVFEESKKKVPGKKQITKSKPKIPKITVTEEPPTKKKVTKQVKSELPKLKEKPVKIRVTPKKEKKPEPAPASSSLSKVFLDLSSDKKKMLQELIDNDELSSNKKSQKRAFNNLEDTHNKFISDSEEIEDVFERMRSASEIQDIIDDDEDEFKLYTILYGKPTKKQIDENLIGGAKFLLNNYKKLTASQLGGFRNFLNSFDLGIQRKLIRENREAYLANVASVKDQTGQKGKQVQKKEAQARAQEAKAKKAFAKEQEEFKKAKVIQDKEAKVGEKLRAQARDASKKANEKYGI